MTPQTPLEISAVSGHRTGHEVNHVEWPRGPQWTGPLGVGSRTFWTPGTTGVGDEFLVARFPSLTFDMVPNRVSGSTRPPVGMTEYAADSCRGEPRCFGNRGDGAAVSECSLDRCVPHAASLLESLGEGGELGGVLGDISEQIGDHAARLIKPGLN
jgi:hypothetical protein